MLNNTWNEKASGGKEEESEDESEGKKSDDNEEKETDDKAGKKDLSKVPPQLRKHVAKSMKESLNKRLRVKIKR